MKSSGLHEERSQGRNLSSAMLKPAETVWADEIAERRGMYLTLSQTTPRIPIADELVMRRVADTDADQIKEVMRGAHVVSEESEREYAETLFEGHTRRGR